MENKGESGVMEMTRAARGAAPPSRQAKARTPPLKMPRACGPAAFVACLSPDTALIALMWPYD